MILMFLHPQPLLVLVPTCLPNHITTRVICLISCTLAYGVVYLLWLTNTKLQNNTYYITTHKIYIDPVAMVTCV